MEPEKQVPPNPPQPPQPVVIHKSYMPLIGAILFLAIVIAGAAFYLGTKTSNTQNQIVQKYTQQPTQAPQQQTTPTAIPTVDPTADWEVANIAKMKDLSFPGYSIKHPTEWIAKETKDDVTQTLTLTKKGDVIKIAHIPTGGNQCVFEGEMPQGPTNDYRNTEYVEVEVSGILLRRIPGKTTHSFCSNSPQSKDSFGIPTVFGIITYTISDNSSLSEMDKIISTLTQNP